MLDRKEIREDLTGQIVRLFEKGVDYINSTINRGDVKENNFLCMKKVEIEDNYIIVRLQGVFDSSTIPRVREQHKDYENQLDKHIIADFNDVEHIDCSTLATLVSLFLALKTHNKKLVIINATEELVAYTDILRLKPVISILASEEDAIAQLAFV